MYVLRRKSVKAIIIIIIILIVIITVDNRASPVQVLPSPECRKTRRKTYIVTVFAVCVYVVCSTVFRSLLHPFSRNRRKIDFLACRTEISIFFPTNCPCAIFILIVFFSFVLLDFTLANLFSVLFSFLI